MRAGIQEATLAILVVVCLANVVPLTIAAEESTGQSIDDFMTPDGRFDLEAARLAGYDGALDLNGADLEIDSRTGEPRLRPSTVSTPAADDPDDVYWDNSLSPSIIGVDGVVYAATIFDGKLVVAGKFGIVGGTVASRIASWDGLEWSELGSGMDSTVLALTVFQGKLIAGGRFTVAGGIAANRVAAWDGSSWSALGGGIDDPNSPAVCALAVFDGKLIAGGKFSIADGRGVNNITQWDGTSWSSVDIGVRITNSPDPYVYAVVCCLVVHEGKLYVGGGFPTPV